VLNAGSLPPGLRDNLRAYQDLASAEKQLNAPFGQFGRYSEVVSTTAVESAAPNDSVARGFDQQLSACNSQRDALVTQIQAALLKAEFGGGTISNDQAHSLAGRAKSLIGNMHTLSEMTVPPSYTVCGS
jgi:hypothetical protein